MWETHQLSLISVKHAKKMKNFGGFLPIIYIGAGRGVVNGMEGGVSERLFMYERTPACD